MVWGGWPVKRDEREGLQRGNWQIVAIEADAVGGEGVDVGAVGVEAAVVAGELGTHVVGHEEEDVEGALAGAGGWRFGAGRLGG